MTARSPRSKAVKVPSEAQEQRALVKWISYHPIVRDYFCKNNNEGKRTSLQGFNLKLMGLRAGVSDLLLYYPTNRFHGLFLEVKRNRKYSKSEMLTETWIAQQEFIKRVQGVGYAAEVCYGFDDGKRIIEEYLLT